MNGKFRQESEGYGPVDVVSHRCAECNLVWELHCGENGSQFIGIDFGEWIVAPEGCLAVFAWEKI